MHNLMIKILKIFHNIIQMQLRNGKRTNNVQNLTLEIKELFSQNKVVKLRKIIKKRNRKLKRRRSASL